MSRLRILVLAPFCDPELSACLMSRILMRPRSPNSMTSHWLLERRVEDNVRRAKAPFRTIEVVRMPLLERIHAWSFRRIFKYNFNNSGVDRFSAIHFLLPLNGVPGGNCGTASSRASSMSFCASYR